LAGPFDPDWNGNVFSRILYSPFHLLTVLITPFEYSGVSIHPLEEAKLSTDGALGTETLLFMVNLMFWLVWVNILLGFTNLIPMVPFDGGHMFRDMVHDGLSKLSRLGERVKLWGGWHPMKIEHAAGKATAYSSLAILFMLLFSILIPYLL
jgi:membrane-associated protease RseP (regulator of RpoE activity)